MVVRQINLDGCVSYIVACENSAAAIIIDPSHELEPYLDYVRDMDIQGAFVQGFSSPATPKDEMLGGLEDRFASVPDEPRLAILKKIMRDHLEGLYEH